MPTFAERVATVALAQFDALPAKSKPRVYSDDRREWTPMSAITLARAADTEAEVLNCVSVATGTKCLPASSIVRCRGTVLHDSHAEVLALRALNVFLLSEIEHLLQTPEHKSRWVEYQRGCSLASNAKLFVLRSDVSIHMFSTEAPCGDASMGLLIESKSQGGNGSWPEPLSTTPLLHGRGYFSLLGAVRRKPSRGDAEQTLSKSCTDKLTLKQFTSLLSFPASCFIERTANTFMKSIILPADKYDADGFARAFGVSGRLCSGTKASIPPNAHHFYVEALPIDAREFPFSKMSATAGAPSKKAGNVSALWIAGLPGKGALASETLVNGVKQGYKQFSESSSKTSAVCRNRMWQRGCQLVGMLQQMERELKIDRTMLSMLEETMLSRTYQGAKRGKLDGDRAAARDYAIETLKGWHRNEGDENWDLLATPLAISCD